MTKTKWTKSPPELVNLFYEVMEHFSEAELRKMFGYPCAFFQGNMFIGLHQNDLIVRLGVKGVEEEKSYGHPFAPLEGRVMKEYLALDSKVLKDPVLVIPFVKKSWEYVNTLPKKEKNHASQKSRPKLDRCEGYQTSNPVLH